MVQQFSEGLALFLDVLSWKLPSSSLLRVSPLGLFTDRHFSAALGGFAHFPGIRFVHLMVCSFLCSWWWCVIPHSQQETTGKDL